MHITIFSTLLILTLMISGTAFAQISIISVQTDDSNYDEGDTILISGSVTTIIGETPVTLQLFKDGNMVQVAQFAVAQDGNFSHTIIAEGPQWKNEGEYIVKVVYGENNVSETSFFFITANEVIQTSDNFEVNAGDSGTFDVRYSIRGGTLDNIVINSEILGLDIDIIASDEGTLVLDLPRQFIDAEKQNGKDEEFIILIDNIQTTYEESSSFSEIRTISVDFEKNDSKIQIIGTHVIPEFGTIVMIILTMGIVGSILLTKNKFQIKI
jgi:predicted secreted protein with PEFG-CTERM motif